MVAVSNKYIAKLIVMEAKAKAMAYGLQIAKKIGFTNMYIETDCRQLV